MTLDAIETAVVRFARHGRQVVLVRGDRVTSPDGYDDTRRGFATPVGTRELLPVERIGRGLWREGGFL